jgi:uncharacterized protein
MKSYMLIEFNNIILAVLIFIVALFYSSVGQAGASGYFAVMALMNMPPSIMKPTALTLNILVAVIATFKFYRVGAFSWRIFWPLAASSVPFAYIGGLLTLPGQIYKPLVGIVLIYAAWRSFHTANSLSKAPVRVVALPMLLVAGAAIGLLSGLTGVGGGIFLSPLLLFFRWAETKVISGIVAAFILVNSVAGLLGVASKSVVLPSALPLWAFVAVVGGFIGAEYGCKRLGSPTIQKLLAIVLLVAGAKMLLTV